MTEKLQEVIEVNDIEKDTDSCLEPSRHAMQKSVEGLSPPILQPT